MRSEDTSGLTGAALAKAVEQDQNTQQVAVCVTGAAVVLVAALMSLTYCGSRPEQIDVNKKMELDARARLQQACVQTGGSWLPVRPSRGSNAYEMSCVSSSGVPLIMQREKNLD